MKKNQFFLAIFLLSSSLMAQDPNFHIYLCFGQSNMVGQGTIEEQDRNVDERFKVFQALDCPNLGRVKETWYTANAPNCQCYTRLSPVDYFGRTMVENLPENITVGIINVSISGCDIRIFDKDIYQDYDATYPESWFLDQVTAYGENPYQYLINLAQLAQQDGVIKGILLHQGETNNQQIAWPTYVQKIYTDMLTDLSLDATNVPILAGELVSAPGNCCAVMNPIINQLPNVIPNAHVISSAGCEAQDRGHFNSQGYRLLGTRYADKMLPLLDLISCTEDNLSINDTLTEASTYSAFQTISSSAQITDNNVIEFIAGEAITLEANFKVETGSSFLARIDNCVSISTVEEIDSPTHNLLQHPDIIDTKKDLNLNIHPNPFNQSTDIELSLSKQEEISIHIFNSNGQLIKKLINNQVISSGKHKILFNKYDLKKGLYLVRLKSYNKIITKRIVVL